MNSPFFEVHFPMFWLPCTNITTFIILLLKTRMISICLIVNVMIWFVWCFRLLKWVNYSFEELKSPYRSDKKHIKLNSVSTSIDLAKRNIVFSRCNTVFLKFDKYTDKIRTEVLTKIRWILFNTPPHKHTSNILSL